MVSPGPGPGPVTQATVTLRQQPGPLDTLATAAGASWGSAAPERFAVRPQAADTDIAALVTVAATPPAAQISLAIMDIQGYNGYVSGYIWISLDMGRICSLDI